MRLVADSEPMGTVTKRPKLLLLFILILAVATRVGAALMLGDRVEVLPAIQDQVSYDTLAQSLLAGKGYQFDVHWYPFTPAHTPTSHWSFLYPLYLASVYGLVGYHPLAARLIQALVAGALTCWLVYRLGRRVGGPMVGLVATAIAALYGYFIYYNAALMTESFHIVAVLLALDLAMQIEDHADAVAAGTHPTRQDLWRWTLLGFVLGLAVLQRQVTMIFVPVLYLWLAWRYRRGLRQVLLGGLLSAGILLLLILPWTVRNYRVFHQFLLLNSNAGFAFYWSNHPEYGFGDALPTNDAGPIPPLPVEASGMNEAQIDRLLTREAIGFILTDPGRFLRRVVGRIPAFFMFYPLAESGLVSNLTRVLSFGITLPFMIYGLFLSRRNWRRYVLLCLFVGTYTLIHLASWPGARYRLPVDAVLIPFAALALVHLWDRLAARRVALERKKLVS
jgi:4-amino-4-deoxy-L-arabinose transferase-like glycosyltransferase